MASLGLILYLSSVLLMSLCQFPTAIEDDRKVYIVYMGALPSKASYTPMSHHHNILQEVVKSSSVEDSLVRNYGRSFNGFAAKLTESERDNLAGLEGVVSVFPSTFYKLLTTRSYEFMGLGDKSKQVPEVETNTIVGVIDGGIWPESKSFSDEGIGPIPKKWKGTCAGGTNFTCNKKVIGARHYVQDSARDDDGHGSHTASTAAGNKVKGVSVNGVAKGTARGGVPLGRVAVYKVCEPAGCNAEGILAAFDDAIADGVDVITISMGGGVTKVDVDPIAIGSFHAMTKGIVTTVAVGNDGSKLGLASNLAPWLISVAAGTTDRRFVTDVVNGDGKTLHGRSINDFDLKGKKYQLAYGKTASNNCTEELARGCASGCLNTVQGKIVVCDVPDNVMEPKSMGAVGVILHVTDVDSPGLGPIPVTTLDDTNYDAFRSYVLTSPNPQGTILKTETVKDNNAPIVASYSSRGPNTLFSDILKPDITAPGVNILAAYSPLGQTALPGQSVGYYFMSGTSMACPHVAGVAAYVKTFHPDWSASAVKSAIMTTAWAMNASKNAEGEFAYGSGHVNPTVAVDPGLVYDIAKEDYLNMLCSFDYSAKGISTLGGGDFTCSEKSKLTMRNLNYPSMTTKVSASSSSSDITFSRTVTNVGRNISTYKAKLTGNPKLSITVEPQTLSFKSSWEKKSFTVTVSGKSLGSLLSFHISTGGFDYVLAPLMNPSYRPSSVEGNGSETQVLPVSGSDLVLAPSQWSSHVVGKVSSWIDLDSEDEVLRMDSEATLKQDIAWATHLSLQACLLPTPKGTSCANYARCVNQILQGLGNLQLWLRVPLVKSDGDSMDATTEVLNDSWELWNSFRLLCEHDSKLSVALDVMSNLPSESSLGRWMGESVRAAIISTDSFLTNARGYPCLSKRHQKLIAGFFDHAVQVVVSGKLVHNLQRASDSNAEGTQRHPLRSYLDYVAYLFQKMEPLPEQERIELGYRDFLQAPLQPLMDNLEAQTYETFERDSIKYIQYQRAVAKALVDRVPDEKASELTTVLMVVGAGRGPLVRASLQAAEETDRKLKVYAVEKNPNAVVTLHNLVKMEGWEGMVTIISCDMRFWTAPEKADILVSELLGSFGDNELSPECLDGAQRFLKPDGISIPSSYTSFIQPVTASKLYNDVKAHKDLAHFETPYVVKLHSVARLAPSQPVFTFAHPNFSTKANNQRYKKLRFNLPSDAGSALVHGFAGYFDSVLYKDVHLGIEPTTETPNMFSWFPIFFPLRKPVEVHPNSPFEVHFWRCCGSTKVWYEWSVSSPAPSPMHNTNGRSHWVGL